jgi:hypothetical protein
MPAAKAKAPKYCLHKPSGRAYIRIRGRVRYIDKYGTPESLEVYGRLVAELAAHRDTPAPPQAQAELTVVELACAYWKFANGYYRKKDGTPSGWLKHIQLVLSKHLSGLYGRTPATEFGPLKFKAIRQTLIDAGHSRPYINKLMAIIPHPNTNHPAPLRHVAGFPDLRLLRVLRHSAASSVGALVGPKTGLAVRLPYSAELPWFPCWHSNASG